MQKKYIFATGLSIIKSKRQVVQFKNNDMEKAKDGEFFGKRVKLAELATITTFATYQLLLIKQPELKQSYKLFISKNISIDTITCIVAKEGKAPFVLLADEMTLRYISFFLNSTWGKLFLIPEDKYEKQAGITNTVLIKNTLIVFHKDMKPFCIILEELMDYLHTYLAKKYKDEDRYSATISRFFSQVRDAMVMELFMPSIFKSYQISVLAPWRKEVEKLVAGVKEREAITRIFDSLVSPGNELMENMNRMRLFMKEFTNFLIKNRQ